MWPIKLNEEELKKIKSILGDTNVVGAESGDYMIFKCTNCDEEMDLTYLGCDPVAPHFKYSCSKCPNKGSFKFQIPTSHNFPIRPS